MLTPERRAELREYAAGIVGVEQTSMLAHPAEMLALLDAADERDRLLRTVSEMTDNLIDAGYSEAELGAERAALAATVERVRALAYVSDDGTRYGHDGHSPIDGYPECPGCWSDGILAMLDGADDE